MPRRYKIGVEPEYDHFFDYHKEKSPFLNPKGQTVNGLLLEASNDPVVMLAEWEGERLQQVQDQLDTATGAFPLLQNKARRTGRPVPETEPDAIRERRLRAEARIDVTNDEITALKRLVDAKAKADAARNADNVLPHGPRGVGVGEPVRMVDGQKVVEKSGELVISCKDSPYNGLPLHVYHTEIVLPFLRACRKARKETSLATAPWPPMPGA